jgi:molybdenum cofactor cytidylyltransferase
MPSMIPRPWVILLAAGGSHRFGGAKQLARIDGESLLRRMARVALGSSAAGCVVVLGARADRLRRELAGLPLRVVVNSFWRRGLSSSLAAGVASLPVGARGALILLADQAAIGPPALELLQAAWRADPRAVVAARIGNTLGPPAILPRGLFREVKRLRGDRGARDLLRDPARRTIGIELPGASVDVDRPADIAGLRPRPAPGRLPRSARSSRARRPRRSGGT